MSLWPLPTFAKICFCYCKIAIQFGLPNRIRYRISFATAKLQYNLVSQIIFYSVSLPMQSSESCCLPPFFRSICPSTIAAYSQINVKCRQIILVSLRICKFSDLFVRWQLPLIHKLMWNVGKFSFSWAGFSSALLFALIQLPLIHKLMWNVAKFRSLWPMPIPQHNLCRIRLVRNSGWCKNY